MHHYQSLECGSSGETPWPILPTSVELIQVKNRGNIYRREGEDKLEVQRGIE
jgi:hypothetical protein